MNDKLIINFTPTGMIPTKKNTPHVPVAPNEIIEQTIEAYEVGITIAHLHARDEHEMGTYKMDIYDEIFSGLRKYCPELVLCASLSGRNFPELAKRTEVLSLQPDMGSLTLSSLNFMHQASINAPETIATILRKMEEHGVHPELECFDTGMINYSKYLIKKNLIKPPFYYNLLVGNIASAQADLLQIGTMVRELPEESFWALGGLGDVQLKTNMISISAGGGVRVGLEDNIWYDKKKTQLATNLALVKRIHSLAQIAEKSIMNAREFGELGFYNQRRD